MFGCQRGAAGWATDTSSPLPPSSASASQRCAAPQVREHFYMPQAQRRSASERRLERQFGFNNIIPCRVMQSILSHTHTQTLYKYIAARYVSASRLPERSIVRTHPLCSALCARQHPHQSSTQPPLSRYRFNWPPHRQYLRGSGSVSSQPLPVIYGTGRIDHQPEHRRQMFGSSKQIIARRTHTNPK